MRRHQVAPLAKRYDWRASGQDGTRTARANRQQVPDHVRSVHIFRVQIERVKMRRQANAVVSLVAAAQEHPIHVRVEVGDLSALEPLELCRDRRQWS